MAKKAGLGLAALSMLTAILPTISAAWSFYNISQGPRDLLEIIKQFFAPFFEVILNTSQYDPFFFTKVLMIILLFVIIKFVLEKSKVMDLEDKPGISVLISAVISILAIRYIPETDIINGILLPYNVLGIAILTILPFIIFFFFIEKSNMGTSGRRLCWIFYTIVFAVLWNSRHSDLSPIGNQIYGWTLAAIVLMIFIDPKIKQYFGQKDWDETRKRKLTLRIAEEQEEIDTLNNAAAAGDAHAGAEVKRKEKYVAKLKRERDSL